LSGEREIGGVERLWDVAKGSCYDAVIMTPGDRSRMDKIEETLGRLVGAVEHFVGSMTQFRADTERWAQETERWRQDTERRIHLMEESHDDSKDRLNALIKIVDDMIRKRPPN